MSPYTNLDEAIVDLHRWQQANQVQVEPIAQINEMVIEWRNEGNDALDYDEQQANEDSDQNVNRVIKKNLSRAQIVMSNRYWIYWQQILTGYICKKAKLQARIKPTALCSAIDKENLIEFPLDFLYYLYN